MPNHLTRELRDDSDHTLGRIAMMLRRLLTPTRWATRLWMLLPFWLGLFAAYRPLANPDEGRYTDIARWMVRSGDWLIPRLNGLPFLHKPPLYFWLEAVLIELFGPGLFIARLVSIGAGLVTCVSIFFLVRRFEGSKVAGWAVAVLATSPLFFGGAQYASLDMLLTALMTTTVTLAVLAVMSPPATARWAWLAAYVFAALGFLTKGLIGIVFPGAIFVFWMVATGRWKQIPRAISPIGIAAFVVISVPWFWAT